MKHRSFVIAGLGVAIGVALAGCTSSDGLSSQYKSGDTKNYISGDGAVTEYHVGDRGEPISFTAKDSAGKTVTAKQFRGKVLVLNFWFASCAPCRAEAKELGSISDAQADHAVFLGVNVRDQAPTINAFVRMFEVPYDSVVDVRDNAVQLAFAGRTAPNATPSTIVLDKEGRVTARILGPINENVLTTLVDDATK